MPEIVSCEFKTLGEAIEHAQSFGGWIARCNDGVILWFDAAHFTRTPILCRIASGHLGGEVGNWKAFFPRTEISHDLL